MNYSLRNSTTAQHPSNSNVMNMDEQPEIDHSYVIAFAYVYVQTTICSIGFILNLINFSVFVRRKFSAPAYIVMTVLSLADAITLAVRIPQGCIFLPHLRGHLSNVAVYIYVYSIYVETPVSNMTENISAWLTVILAIERYISMKHWSISKRYFSRPNTRRLVCIICLIAVIFNIPYFAIQRVSFEHVNGILQMHSDMTSFSLSGYYATYSWMRIVLVQIIPLCFLCISNCLLLLLVSQHNQKFSAPKSGPTNQIVTTGSYDLGSNKQKGVQRRMRSVEFVEVETQIHAIEPTNQVQSNNGGHIVMNEAVNSETPMNPITPIALKDTTGVVKSGSIRPDHRSSKSGSCDRNQKRRSAQTKLTILLIAVILLFLIGQVPQSFAYVRVFTALGACSIDSIQTCVAYQFYRMITINLAQFAFASTFFVYLFLNRDFRQTLVETVLKLIPSKLIAYCQRSNCCKNVNNQIDNVEQSKYVRVTLAERNTTLA